MRIPVIAGNWKMNNTVTETRSLVFELSQGLRNLKGVEKVIFPPFPSLLTAAALVMGTDIGVGAQNLHWEEKGAFTGEVSASMVVEFCKYVLVGHSERRAYFGETDGTVNKKIKTAITHGLVPVMCVGESLSERENNQTREVITRQVSQGLAGFNVEQVRSLVIAYEPVWAIGTGRASSGSQATEVIGGMIRPALKTLFGESFSQSTRVLYGGSVSSTNIEEFMREDEIDGALVGGASLKAEEFIKITQAAVR